MTTSINIPFKEYPKLFNSLKALPPEKAKGHLRNLARLDLYFLIRYIFNREDFDHPWLFDRCREVQEEPYGYLDLWSRDHRKSTIITYGHSIQEILASHGEDPLLDEEVTICILSHTRPIAKSFLRQIKRELEQNKLLIELFPDVLYENPDKDAQSWSEDAGLIVQRKSNPKEATVEAHGLVDGQPTGKHFNRLVYDDVVTLKSVTSPEQIQKTTDAWALSLNLGSSGKEKRKYIGTRYHMNDTYREMMKRGAAKPRIYPGTKEGTLDGTPVLLTKEQWEDKVREMGTYVASAQLLQNPVADSTQGLKREWLRHHQIDDLATGMNKLILVDPANTKNKKSDWTSIWVIGMGADKNYYILDGVRDKLNLGERTRELMRLHHKWQPKVVGYERYGMQADIDFIKEKQRTESYNFDIVEIGGSLAKNDRIKRLVPILEENRIYLPMTLHKTLYDGKTVDIIEEFLVEEYDAFPVPVHDDGLDNLARIFDIECPWPKYKEPERKRDRYSQQRSTGWMGRL